MIQKLTCKECGKTFEEENLMLEVLGLDLPCEDSICPDCLGKRSCPSGNHDRLIEELQEKFNIKDANKMIHACLMMVNMHSGDNFKGLNPNATYMKKFINDFIKLYEDRRSENV